VVVSGSDQKQEFKVTSDTVLIDKASNRSNHLDLLPGMVVAIKVKAGTAAWIRTFGEKAGRVSSGNYRVRAGCLPGAKTQLYAAYSGARARTSGAWTSA
jgi:hypothetical protein